MTSEKQKASPLQVENRNVALYIAGILLLVVIAVKYFVESIVLPAVGNFFSMYVPAKGGGRSYFVDPTEFNTVSLIAVASAIGLTLLVGLFVKLKKDQGIVATVFIYCLTATTYVATVLGNAVYAVWGGAWFLVPVIGSIAGMFVLEAWLMRSLQLYRRNKLRKD